MPTKSREAPSGSPSRISRNQILQAARLHYDFGHSQREIAEKMSISQSYLARLLERAHKLGWVKVVIDADREMELAARIRDKYPILRRVEVVPSYPERSTTALAVATAMAGWFNETVDRDEELAEPTIKRVAIGGSWPMRLMIDQLDPRPNRLHVGPTALTPSHLGQQDRFTAPMLATLLAFRFGALPPANVPAPPGAAEPGRLFSGSFDPGSPRSPEALRKALEEFVAREGFAEIADFWRRTDIAFISTVRADLPYSDVRQRLEQLRLESYRFLAPGGALVANRLLDEAGQVVPLCDGVESYEPVLPTEVLRAAAGADSSTRRRHVVLEAWGDYGRAAEPVLRAGLANVLVCDAVVGRDLLHLSA